MPYLYERCFLARTCFSILCNTPSTTTTARARACPFALSCSIISSPASADRREEEEDPVAPLPAATTIAPGGTVPSPLLSPVSPSVVSTCTGGKVESWVSVVRVVSNSPKLS